MHSKSHLSEEQKSDPAAPAAGESIGRPGPWREDRYEKPGTPAEPSVVRQPGEGPPDTRSTTVTLDDYEHPPRK